MYLSREEIDHWRPATPPPGEGDHAGRLRARLKRHGILDRSQCAGRNWAMGCVALEVTQRCNLDCSLCYLSDRSEAVRDLPLVEIYRRIDMIRAHYGADTPVQITGGDPTLRKRCELAAIVARIESRGMVPALFTNGIRATRGLLAELATAGLVDVAFHVDMTQGRRGYGCERDLNAVRRDYIERARGLGLNVLFNTTVFGDNLDQVPDIARFFRRHADVVDMASFQLQADTGRGVLRRRDAVITQDAVAGKIQDGAGTALSFGAITLGHPRCNRYATCVVANGTAHDLLGDAEFITGLFERTARFTFRRDNRLLALATTISAALANPDLIGGSLAFVARQAWRMRRDLVKSRGRVHKLSFFIHNFMDAENLERDRCESCIYMVATAQGPISMCVHNARRDAHILKPIPLATDDGERLWDPLTGATRDAGDPVTVERLSACEAPVLPRKRLKGRARAERERNQHRASQERLGARR